MKRAVRRAVKALAWALAIVVIVPLAGIAYYDVARFQPHADEIHKIITDAHHNDRSPPAMLRKLLREPRDDLSLDASRLLIFKLDPEATRQGNLVWQRNSLLWWLLVKVHLSEDEQLAVICSTSFLGRRAYGFEAGANTYFDRSLDRLTDSELATLAVRAHSPSRWQRADRQDDLAKAADNLLARVRGTKMQ